MGEPEAADLQRSVARCTARDVEELLRFRAAVHGPSSVFADIRHFRWQHEEGLGPRDGTLSCWIARRGGRIEGQIGGTHVGLKVGTREVEALWTLDGAVDPARRGKGIFSALLAPAEAERDLTMATESSPSAKRAMIRAGWTDLGTLEIFVRPLDVRRTLQARGRPIVGAILGPFLDPPLRALERGALLACAAARLRLEEVEQFDGRSDAVWKQAAPFYPVIGRRDRAFLDWRFGRFPAAKFRSFYLRRGSETVGFAVLRAGFRGGVPAIHLVDFLCPPKLLTGLLLLVLDVARRSGAAAVSCLHRNPVSTSAFTVLGFARRDTGWPFVAKVRSLPPDEQALVQDPVRWYLTGADSDLDRPRPE